MLKRIFALCATVVFGMGVFLSVAQAQKVDGKWVLVNEETGTWERSVIIQGRKLSVRAFVLTESGRASFFVHEPCKNGKTERLVWSAGDGYGLLIDCNNNAIRSSLPTLIEREIQEGLPAELQKKMRKFHRKKGVLVLKNAPVVRFSFC